MLPAHQTNIAPHSRGSPALTTAHPATGVENEQCILQVLPPE